MRCTLVALQQATRRGESGHVCVHGSNACARVTLKLNVSQQRFASPVLPLV
jgi:hypothetical protein